LANTCMEQTTASPSMKGLEESHTHATERNHATEQEHWFDKNCRQRIDLNQDQ